MLSTFSKYALSGALLAFSAMSVAAEDHAVTAKEGHDGFVITPECIAEILDAEVQNPTYANVAQDLSGPTAAYSVSFNDKKSVYIAAANN